LQESPVKQNRVLILLLSSTLAISGAAFAKAVPSGPVKHPVKQAHPNLVAAQHDLEQAWSRIGAAQQANEFDAAGHAQKAKELINRAYEELKLADKTGEASEKPAGDADKK
jgi:hypothetical protein